jgi:hypothetical protein
MTHTILPTYTKKSSTAFSDKVELFTSATVLDQEKTKLLRQQHQHFNKHVSAVCSWTSYKNLFCVFNIAPKAAGHIQDGNRVIREIFTMNFVLSPKNVTYCFN